MLMTWTLFLMTEVLSSEKRGRTEEFLGPHLAYQGLFPLPVQSPWLAAWAVIRLPECVTVRKNQVHGHQQSE